MLLLTYCLGIWLALPLHAQGWWRLPWKKAPATQTVRPGGLSSSQISKQLSRRAAQSFQQAKRAQSELTSSRPVTLGEPTRKILHPQDMPTANIYEDKPFLTTRQQAADYMAARNNRLFLQELQRLQQLWKTLDKALPLLQEQARQTPQPENPVPWIAQQIPTNTSLLFVGEVHGYETIHLTTASLLKELRAMYPQKRIILFSEFLPDTQASLEPVSEQQISSHLRRYMPVWQAAYQQDIQVVGLEKEYVIKDTCYASVLNQKGKYRYLNMWATLEGVRLRNEHWTQLLQNYRAQYPDALFVVYSGAAHSLYNYPFTLSTNFPSENTFVVALYPDKYIRFESSSFFAIPSEVEAEYPGPLESLLNQDSFPQTVLQFQEDALSKMAGFNVRIKVPVNLDVYRLEHNL